MRFSTSVRLERSDQLLNRDGEIARGVANRENHQRTVNELLSRADDIYNDFLHDTRREPTTEEFKSQWVGYDSKGAGMELLHRYSQFKAIKEKGFRIAGKPQSLKDYNALEKRLEDFQVYLGKTIQLNHVNQGWLMDFEEFITTERENWLTGGEYNVKQACESKGTVLKRFATLKRFFEWLDTEGHFDLPKWLPKYKVNTQTTRVKKSVLTKDEFLELYRIPLDDETEQFVRDSFVFCCMTGVRWSDMTTLSEDDIYDMEDGQMLIKDAVKTGIEFQVHLSEEAIEILDRYGYDFDRLHNVPYNKTLKKILMNQEWCRNKIKSNGKKIERWKAISHHRGRDSFITMLVTENVALNDIMKYTGHTTVANLNKYIDRTHKPKNHIKALFN